MELNTISSRANRQIFSMSRLNCMERSIHSARVSVRQPSSDSSSCSLRACMVSAPGSSLRGYHRAPQHTQRIIRASAGSSIPSPALSRANPFFNVVLPTSVTLMLCNMDRICMSVAILPMAKEFAWSASVQGIIQSAFLWGYMATQLLGGTMADKYGGKRVMACGIAWFSAASLLVPLALSAPVVAKGLTLPALLAARCLVGLGEGVALPTMSNLVATHIPKEARARALGLAFSGFHGGNLLGLILSPILLIQFGWRSLFYIFGALGAPMVAVWMATVPSSSPGAERALKKEGASGGNLSFTKYRGKPGTSSFRPEAGAGSSPQSFITSEVTLAKLLSKAATWAIIVVNVVNHWGYFIYLNWMPSYFNAALGFDLRSSSFLSFLPWLVMATGSSLAGLLADSLVSSGVDVTSVRKRMQTVAFLVPAVALLVLAQPGLSPTQAVAAMTVALGTTSLGQAGFVANMSDIAPKHAGKMFGLCNTFGCLSGILGTTAVGFIVEATGSFRPVFLLTAFLYVAATLVWNVFCTGEVVFN